MIPLTVPTFTKDMEKAAVNALHSEMLVGGESVFRFEEEFAKYIGTDYAVAVNSGSSALLLTFYSLGVKPGDKVITPSATFIATISGSSILGGVPIFCEIGNDYLMSLESLKKFANSNYPVKYIIPVHLYGHPCNMDGIKEFAQHKGAAIVEDAAQAHGATYKARKVGCFGEAAVFSFYPTKNMTVCGDGGMITTNSNKVYESAKKMRDVGRVTKYTHDRIAYTLRLNSVNAAIGRVQLKHLDEWNEKRRTLAKRYYTELYGVGDLILPPESDANCIPVYHMYAIRTKQRNSLGAWLSINNISTSVHYPIPVHKQPACQVYQNGIDLSFTNQWSDTVLSIPIYPTLEHKNQEYVIEMIEQFYDDKLYESERMKEAGLAWGKKLV